MNMNTIFVCGIISLLWFVNEILSIKVYENVTENQDPPFTIDASSKQVDPTAPADTQTINLFLPESSQVPTDDSKIFKDHERLVKAQKFVAETQKLQSISSMVVKSTLPPPANHQNDASKNESKKQSWEIPSPLSPLSTSDPKATNSSKRQTGYNNLSFDKTFVPSQELGSYDNTEGFVPHVYHEPKTITYVPQNYMQAKPIKHDLNYGYAIGESRLPVSAVKGLQSFEHDFDDLKAKYPELNDLVNNYPIMEEIMKQKLAEKFQQSQHARQNYAGSSYTVSSTEKWNSGKYMSTDQNQDYLGGYKYPSLTNDNVGGTQQNDPLKTLERPYSFESDKLKWISTKKPPMQLDASTAETPFAVPAGEFYQGPKFPITTYGSYEDKNNTSVEIKGVPQIEKPKKPVSPWKRVLHLITAFLPVGILISALTPNVINIANVPNKNYPYRHRSLDDTEDVKSITPDFLISYLNGNVEEDSKHYHDDPECDERRFCEMSRKGKEADASVIEMIFWNLARSTPDHVSEAAGMKKLFKAIKNGECSQFRCKKNLRHRLSISADKFKNSKTNTKTGSRRSSALNDNISSTAPTEEVTTSRNGGLKRVRRTRDNKFVSSLY